MKRFHIHVGVKDLEKSVQFYTTLFGQRPSKLKSDYAKWMMEDPRLNFAISTRAGSEGVNHLGFQVDAPEELVELTTRLKQADVAVEDAGETTCCYARSNKSWVQDPSGMPWEAYQTMADADIYQDDGSACCGPSAGEESCCG
jgi:catechol 2,3-dioxygenase-like lactoylglutathione lyase family enzyme